MVGPEACALLPERRIQVEEVRGAGVGQRGGGVGRTARVWVGVERVRPWPWGLGHLHTQPRPGLLAWSPSQPC